MKTKPRFMRRFTLLFAAIASAAVMTFAGTVGQTPGISFQMLDGTWETYDASATGRQVTLSFNDDGTMQVCRVTSGVRRIGFFKKSILHYLCNFFSRINFCFMTNRDFQEHPSHLSFRRMIL